MAGPKALREDQYFTSNPAPKNLEHHVSLVRDFINFHSSKHRVVLVTSGGTTVPLEKQTVRFSMLATLHSAICLGLNSCPLPSLTPNLRASYLADFGKTQS